MRQSSNDEEPRQLTGGASRRPPLLLVAIAVLGMLVYWAGSKRLTSASPTSLQSLPASVPQSHLTAAPGQHPGRAAAKKQRHTRSRDSHGWVPKMGQGLVAAKQGKVPAWHQCWAPLCSPCVAEPAGPGALAGLHIYVLSHGAPKEHAMRTAIRQTWGPQARALGASVQFVIGDSLHQWASAAAAAIRQEQEQHNDILLVGIRDFSGNPLEDSYVHLAYKVASLASLAVKKMGSGSWFMKVDTDTYLNVDRVAMDIARYRLEFQRGGGAWQYAGYHNNGKVQVRSDPKEAKTKKALAWLEVEYGAVRKTYPPYAFGAAGWLLGYDALSFMVHRAADPAVLRPKVNEDAMVGALLEACATCVRQSWKPCEILGGTSFPFAANSRQGGCPTIMERIGMAAADKQLDRFRCLVTVSELKGPKQLLGVHGIVTDGEL